MKHIRKTISLEQFKSRLPLLYNSYGVDGLSAKTHYYNTEYFEFSVDDLYDGKNNYNMIPCDIILTEEITNNWDDIKLWTRTFNNEIHLPYSIANQMYYFFKRYDALLSKYNDICDEGIVSSATEFYDTYVSSFTINNDAAIYDYEEMDKLYMSYNGDVMKNFLYNNVFKTFIIPLEYVDAWNIKTLWLTDCAKWFKWFDERHLIYSSSTKIEDCIDTNDCCDCKEYIKRGGNTMWQLLKNFLNDSAKITFDVSSENTYIELPILLTKTIDDMGEFSIFNNEWEGGVDYTSGSTAFYDDHIIMKINNNDSYEFDSDCKLYKLKEENWVDFYKYNFDNDFKNTEYENQVFSSVTNYVSGFTSSKLDLLKDNNISCDDIGNKLKGKFKPSKTLNIPVPLENSTLDLYYTIGNVSRLTPIYNEDDNIICYWGDLLFDISFKYENEMHEFSEYKSSDYNGNNLSAITLATNEYMNYFGFENENDISDKLVCTFTYYLGTLLTFDNVNNKYILYESNDEISTHGVKYVENYILLKEQTSFSISNKFKYNIYYYEMKPYDVVVGIYPTPLGVKDVKNTKSIFNLVVNNKFEDSVHDRPIEEQYGYSISGLTFSRYNNENYAPVFREEYKFGTASLQHVEDNVKIDRGIIKPHEKNIKLTEVSTLEDLEQYNNGFFNIIKNS